jgi:hypothetical protein
MPLTISEMARGLNLSRTAVRNHVAQGMPLTSVRAAQAWRARHLDPSRIERGKAAHGGPVPEPTDLSLARTTRIEAANELAQLALLEKRGVLARRNKVRAEFARSLAGLRGALLQIPARLAPVIAAAADPTQIGQLLADEFDQVLAAFDHGGPSR